MRTETADPEAWQPVNEILHQQDKGELLRKVQEAELHTHTHSHKYVHIHTLSHILKEEKENLKERKLDALPVPVIKLFGGWELLHPSQKPQGPGWVGVHWGHSGGAALLPGGLDMAASHIYVFGELSGQPREIDVQ